MSRAPSPIPKACIKSAPPLPHGKCWYVGDTVDDARASQRGAAFRSSVSRRKSSPRYDELVRLLRAEGAVAVLDDINSLEAAIAENS